ncbi:hypothetical protein AB3S75_042955 [Citrus x aurantiifolia]
MSSSMAKSPSHFFKAIRASTIEDKKLMIPQEFVRKFGHELSSVATLAVANGCVWRVGLTKDEGSIWFQNGWHAFVEYHSISAGYFVVFRYRKNSSFQVFILDNLTYCGIQYPSKNSCTPSKHNGYEMQGEKPRMEGMEEKNEPDNMNESMPDEIDIIKLLEDMRICVCESMKFLSVKERQAAIEAAKSIKPEKPSFLVVLQTRNMMEHVVYVPATFAQKYLSGDSHVVAQDSRGGSKLATKMKSSSGECFLTGWLAFFEENHVREGDILILEMIKKKNKNILLKVSVVYT